MYLPHQGGGRLIATNQRRSTLPKHEARQRYVEIAQTVVLEQIKLDSERLDGHSIVVGPFARLDANKVAALDGKTRGAITNLFGSQAAFQADTMARALSAGDLIEQIEYPAPGDFPDADAWVDALFAAESARGPMHGGEPTVNYAYLWALWLSVVPYGLWSEQIARPSMEEYARWLERLEQVLEQAIGHFALTLQEGTTVGDLASAVASMIEGVWLNQCLSTCDPTDPSEPVATAMRRSGRLLWRGATRCD
jgi:BetI-type transcriptional repressor, C-terminal